MGSELQETAGLDCVVFSRQGTTTVRRRSWMSSSISFRSLTRSSSGGQGCLVVFSTLPGRIRGRLALSS